MKLWMHLLRTAIVMVVTNEGKERWSQRTILVSTLLDKCLVGNDLLSYFVHRLIFLSYCFKSRLVSVKVQEGVTYYHSNLKTTIKDIKKLTFTDAHLKKIKMTPLWVFFDAICQYGGEKLMQKTDKVDRDISSIIKC